MKKAAAVLSAVLFLAAAGCTGEDAAPELKIGSNVSCRISCGGRDYRCTLSFISDDVENITLTSPESVKGITFGSYSGNHTISAGTLICRSDSRLLPESSVPARIHRFIRRLKADRREIKLFPADEGYKNDELPGMDIRTDEHGMLTELIIK